MTCGRCHGDLRVTEKFGLKETAVEAFAVNVDPDEGRLQVMSGDDFEVHYGFRPLPYDATDRAEDLAEQDEALRGTEYGAWLLSLVVCLLLVEMAMAYWFGRGGR